MSKTIWTISFIWTFLVIGLILSQSTNSAIVGSGNSNININVFTGSFIAANCTAGNAVTGFGAGGTPICNPFVFSITQGVGLLFNPDPITQSAVISLKNATITSLGGVRVLNCSGGGHVSGWNGSLDPICSGDLANGSVTSISEAEGIVLNPNPIVGTGVVLLANATNMTLGGIRLANCTGTSRFSGFNASLNPICTATSSASGGVVQIMLYEGLSSNESPIVSNATLVLNNATTTTIGGSRVLNCSGNGHVSGWDGSMNPFCSANNGNGTITSLASGSGITLNPDPIISTGTIMATNATLSVLGVTKLTNCSTGFYLNGWNATNIPNCVGELNNGTVTSVATGTGLTGGIITGTGTISLLEALTGTIGGVKVANCTAGDFFNGYSATNIPTCGTPSGIGSFIRQITLGVGLQSNESPIITNASLFLKNASISEIGGILASNCTSGQGVIGITAGGSLLCGSVLNSTNISMQLLYSNNTDLNLTVSGDCYKYELPANNYSQIVATGYGGLHGDNAGSPVFWNATINFSNTVMEDQQVKSGAVIATNWIMPVSLSYTQSQQSSLNITMRSVEVSDGGSFLCKSFYVWGVNNGTGTSSGGVGNVKEIKWYTPLSGNESPIISNGTLMVLNATTLAEGVVRVANCTIGKHISGYDSSNAPICSADQGNPYCNPLINEMCKFIDFNGDGYARYQSLTQVFDVYTASIASPPAGLKRTLEQSGSAFSTSGFLMASLTGTAVSFRYISFLFPETSAGGVYCTGVGQVLYNCSKIMNTSNILELSVRFSNVNLSSSGNMQTGGRDNETLIFGYITRNDTALLSAGTYLPNNLQNMIAFYHHFNQSNWSAITMLGGNTSNTTTILPLPFNSTAHGNGLDGSINGSWTFNTFRIVRENSTGNMLFYINTSLVANHSTNIPDWAAEVGFTGARHNITAEDKWFIFDWMKIYHKTRNDGINGLSESYP